MIDLRDYLSSTSADPKKILRLVISISVLLLVIWLFMISRMEIAGASADTDPAMQERADSIRTTLIQPDLPTAEGPRDSGRSSGVFLNALTTFIILVSILAAVWLWVRKKSGTSRRDLFDEVGTQVLGQGSQLKVIEMNDEIWVLGISSGSVNLLHRYSREEWKQPEAARDPEEKSFYQIFRGKT